MAIRCLLVSLASVQHIENTLSSAIYNSLLDNICIVVLFLDCECSWVERLANVRFVCFVPLPLDCECSVGGESRKQREEGRISRRQHPRHSLAGWFSSVVFHVQGMHRKLTHNTPAVYMYVCVC